MHCGALLGRWVSVCPPAASSACMGVGPGEALQKRKGQVEEDVGRRGL